MGPMGMVYCPTQRVVKIPGASPPDRSGVPKGGVAGAGTFAIGGASLPERNWSRWVFPFPHHEEGGVVGGMLWVVFERHKRGCGSLVLVVPVLGMLGCQGRSCHRWGSPVPENPLEKPNNPVRSSLPSKRVEGIHRNCFPAFSQNRGLEWSSSRSG